MALSVSYSVMVDLGCTLPDCRDSLAPASTERGISPNRGANYMAAYLSPNQRTQFTLPQISPLLQFIPSLDSLIS